MIAIALDPARSRVAVAGRGDAALRRARLLAEGAASVALFIDHPPGADLPRGVAVRPQLPAAGDLPGIRALWIAGLGEAEAAALAQLARQAGALVNVEDRPALCDFHSVAEVRRGDLLITVSTAGRSPGLAARIRARIAAAFGPEWAARTAALGERRQAWRARGASIRELARMTDEAIDAGGWMP
jgi:precorrin-2 dehydrogenase / sirohydrochlorin ferrochelatase